MKNLAANSLRTPYHHAVGIHVNMSSIIHTSAHERTALTPKNASNLYVVKIAAFSP